MPARGGTRFYVTGVDSLEMPLRVLNLFVLFGFEPDRIVLDRCSTGFELLVELPGGSEDRVSLLLEKIQALVLVSEARIEPQLRAQLAA